MRSHRLFMLFILALAPFAAFAQTGHRARVTVVAEAVPSKVMLTRDQQATLDLAAGAQQKFEGVLGNPFSGAQKNVLSIPYVLTVKWKDASDDVYLELHRTQPVLECEVHGPAMSGNVEELHNIDAKLSRENMPDQLKRYFQARAFYQAWKAKRSSTDHQVAILAVKNWFDGSVFIAGRYQSPYRMDQQVLELVRDYHKRAETDSSLRKTVNRLIPKSYVDQYLDPLRFKTFQQARLVETWRQEGSISEAAELNGELLKQMEAMSAAERSAVVKYHGVSLDNLRKAAADFSQARGS